MENEEQIKLVDELGALAEFVERNPAPVLRFNEQGIIDRANPAAIEILGDDIEGSSIDSLFATDFSNGSRADFEKGALSIFEHEVLGKCIQFTVKKEEQGRGGYCFGSDVTKLKEAETKLTEWADYAAHNPAPVFRIDQNGKIIHANSSAKRIFGEKNLLEKTIRQLMPSICDPDAVFFNLTAGIGVYEQEIGGRHYQFVVRGFEGKGTINVYGSDVTELKANEQERLKIKAQLQHSESLAALGLLVGGVAHASNNLLTGVLGFADLAKDALETGSDIREAVFCITNLMKGAREIAALNQQLLAAGRRRILEPRNISLVEVVREHESMYLTVKADEVRFTLTQPTGPMVIFADKASVKQILMNLSTNAEHAMSGLAVGKLSIETSIVNICTAPEPEHIGMDSGDYAVITVSDNGHGMTQKVTDRIFEPFYTTKELGEGTGLGLSAAYGEIEQQGGYIRVQSVVGQGTVFSLYFPLVDCPPDYETKRIFRSGLQGKGRKVLLADDDAAVRDVGKRMLQRIGFEVIIAIDGDDACMRFNEHCGSLSLALLDFRMPGKNGKEVAEYINRSAHPVPVVYCTGYEAGQISREYALPRGTLLVSKPFTSDELTEKIHQALGDKK